MPTYGYRCTACSHEFERFQKISDPAVAECETCGAAVKKIIYPVGIQFKGSGFYINDYAAKPAASEGSSAPAAPESAPAPEAKPAATPAPAAATPTTASTTS
ncbi:MAG: hypothetical protein H7Z41_00770 [Cytophagales bacterium]|nr:hypothetical protein [Armatimonadota bacterium]